MDDEYLRHCIRYVAMNPVRAGLVRRAADWPWSSVRAHLGEVDDPLLASEGARLAIGDPVAFFAEAADSRTDDVLRMATGNGRPLGNQAWLSSLKARGIVV